MHATEHLEQRKWEHPDSYAGFSPDGDFLVLARNRDSDILTESNWHAVREDLKAHAETLDPEPLRPDHPGGDVPYVYDWRAGHWACGWVEYLMIREDAPDSLKALAGAIVAALANYPVYSEDDYSQRQDEARAEYWDRASLSERMDWCRDAGCSIFVARRDYMDQWPESLVMAFYNSEMFA